MLHWNLQAFVRAGFVLALASQCARPAAGGTIYFETVPSSGFAQLWRADATTYDLSFCGPLWPDPPLPPNFDHFDTARGIALSPQGDLYWISTNLIDGDVYRGDKITALSENLPFTTYENSGHGMAVRPDGKIYFVSMGGFQKGASLTLYNPVSHGTTTLGPVGVNFDAYNGLALDAGGNLFTIEQNSNTFWKVNSAPHSDSGVTLIGPLVSVTAGVHTDLTYDPATHQIVGYASSSRSLFTVDPTTGAATVFHTFPAGIPNFGALTFESCLAPMSPYGKGCVGTGNFTPTLSPKGCATAGSTIGFELRSGKGGSVALFFFGAAQAEIPLGGSCYALIQPINSPLAILPLSGAAPGVGQCLLSGTVPPNLQGISVTLQAFVIDSGSSTGASATQGVRIDF